MTVQLTASDFQRLVRIIARDDSFRSVDGRIRLITGALYGSPRADDILAQINFDGAAQGVAVEIVRRLSVFGRVTRDREALGIFLNYLLFYKGDEDPDAVFIRTLFDVYSLDKPIVSGQGIDTWHGREDDKSVQEKIIGENTLCHISVLELALDVAKSVVHITLPGGYGTGFMIAPDLLMTNNHVLDNIDIAKASLFTFDYQLDINGKLMAATSSSVADGGLFYTNPGLDYTVVQLSSVDPGSVKPLLLKPALARHGDRVTIIQHPGGHVKMFSMQNNFVVYADERVVQYTTSTMPGSSGSPVFDDAFRVIAIHHSGGMLPEPGAQRRYLRNEGISMVAIWRDLGSKAHKVYERLNR